MAARRPTLQSAMERFVEQAEASSAIALERLTQVPRNAVLALTLLVLALHLPPLDRTEVIYAQTAKQIIESGNATSPSFQTEPKFEKPLPVLWLQAATARVTGAVDQIRGYRIPSLIGTWLAVLFTYLGARHILNPRIAVIGAGLLATMLVVTVQATLAMPEAMMLAATCAAMLAMARIYAADDGAEPMFGTALAFWIALGAGMLVNVLTVPLIAALTAAALVAWDRGRAGWLLRLRPLAGIPLMLAIAAMWPLALWLGGTLDAAIVQWKNEGWHLLLGPQEMKWRVALGLFIVFLLLGLFPAGLLLAPAAVTAWRERASRPVRFLIAWGLPYLVFLEVLTRKTPLYMVQAMLPPMALLFAIWIVRGAESGAHEKRWFRLGTYGWLALVAGLVAALWALPFLLKQMVSPVAIGLGVAVLAAAVFTTSAMLSGRRLGAALGLVVLGVAFNNLTVPVTFAGLKPVWVASEVRAAVDTLKACKPGDVRIAGFKEPSAVFELGTDALTREEGVVYTAWSATEFEAWQQLTDATRIGAPGAVACVAAYDFIHACSHRFTIWARGTPAEFARCPLPARYRCENVPKAPMVGRMCK